VSVIDLREARRLAFGLVLGQAGVTVAVALAAWGLAGARAALSALVGGGIATVGSLAMAGFGFAGAPGAGARRVVGAFYFGEAVKLTLVAVLFALVLKWVRVEPRAMLAGFAATFPVYWVGLLGALPAVGGARGGA
jgi:ATP synthase protein I